MQLWRINPERAHRIDPRVNHRLRQSKVLGQADEAKLPNNQLVGGPEVPLNIPYLTAKLQVETFQ